MVAMRTFDAQLPLWLLLPLLFCNSAVAAQQQNRDSSSQRILPLPESEISDSETQMQLLKRLRSLVKAADESKTVADTKSDDPSKIDDKQLDQLQQVLKNLQDQLPPGIKPPELDSIPKERLDEAMSNPAVQQQLRKMLEQFAKDGLLPRSESGKDSQVPPTPKTESPKRGQSMLPRNSQLPPKAKPTSPTEPQGPPDSIPQPATPDQDASADPGNGQPQSPATSWQSLKDAMKKLAEIAQGGNKTPPNSPQDTAEKTERNDDGKQTDEAIPEPTIPESGNNSQGRPANQSSEKIGEVERKAQNNRLPNKSNSTDRNRNRESETNASNDAINDVHSDDDHRSDIDAKSSVDDELEQGSGEKQPQQPSLKAFQELLERYKNSQRQQSSDDGAKNDSNAKRNNDEINSHHDDAMPLEISPRPQSSAPNNPEGNKSQDSSKRVIRRPDRTSPVQPPDNVQPRISEQGEVFPPPPLPPRQVPASPNSNPTRKDEPNRKSQRNPSPSQNSSGELSGSASRSRSSPENSSIPSVAEFLKEQMEKGFPVPGSDDNGQNADSSSTNRRSPKSRPESSPPQNSQSMNSRPQTGPGANSDPRSSERRNRETQGKSAPSAAAPAPKSVDQGLDVRRELEKRGIRGTIEKIVQKAKEESKAKQAQQESVVRQPGAVPVPPGQPVNPIHPLGNTKMPDDPGLQKSLGDLLGGLDESMQDIVKDAKFSDRPMDNKRNQDSAWQQAPPVSKSRLSQLGDAASGFFSDLSKAPQTPSMPQSSTGGGAISADAPMAMGSFFVVILVLLGLLGVVAYLLRRPLLKLVSDATGIAAARPVLQSSEIRSRADVIAAFHSLALSPKLLVESWWTHRAAAQKLSAESPQTERAVQTLAEIYEQARYLPDDVEFPADSIQSARTALSECQV